MRCEIDVCVYWCVVILIEGIMNVLLLRVATGLFNPGWRMLLLRSRNGADICVQYIVTRLELRTHSPRVQLFERLIVLL